MFLQEFLQLTCRDFEWLYQKCKSKSLTDVLMDLDHAVSTLNSELTKNKNQIPRDSNETNVYTEGFNDNDQLESVDSNTLMTYVQEIEHLRAMLVLGSDAIRKDPCNLALQVR